MITATKKNDKRSERLAEEEINWLKQNLETSTMSALALNIKVERTALHNTIARGSAHPTTVKKIRRAYLKQIA